jgi:Lrp/AsnC family leucine-responsive transcriptional regulator
MINIRYHIPKSEKKWQNKPVFGEFEKSMLERKDQQILAELQLDSRLTMQELADRVGMSTSACWRRVKALETDGIISRYAVIVDTRKAGFGLSSMVHVSLARHEQKHVDHFLREVSRHPEVLE